MVFMYIIIDEILDETDYKISIWKFSPEKSLRLERLGEVERLNVIKLIDLIESLLEKYKLQDIAILSSRKYVENFLDDDISNYSHIRIKYRDNTGYIVRFVANSESRYKSYNLLDTSAYGIKKALTRLQ